MALRVLMLAGSEICFNPRLVKAADALLAAGAEVTVVSPYLGKMDRAGYVEFNRRRHWRVLDFDISKTGPLSWLRWAWWSAVQRLAEKAWLKGRRICFPYAFSKTAIAGNSVSGRFDVVWINLVDNLPVALKLKAALPGARIVYDSQEFFRGQYSTEESWRLRWVREAEKDADANLDVVLATTGVMRRRIVDELGVPEERVFRVRNVPYRPLDFDPPAEVDGKRPLRLIWHGMSIYYRNRRGLHVIVEAVGLSRSRPHLYVQGIEVVTEVAKLRQEAERFGIADRVHIVPPADPDQIVKSLTGYDVGVAGECPEEDNQRLTSSNKLFEWIGAGLATLMPDLPGLRETVDEYKTGLLYEPASAASLAIAMDELDADRNRLLEFRRNALTAARNELHWEHDFAPVREVIF